MSTQTRLVRTTDSARAGAPVMAAAPGDEAAWRTLVQRDDRLVPNEIRRVQRLLREDYEDAVERRGCAWSTGLRHLNDADVVVSPLRTIAYREARRIGRGRARPAAAKVGLTTDNIGVEPDLTHGVLRDHPAGNRVRDARSRSHRERLLAALLEDPDLSYRELEADHARDWQHRADPRAGCSTGSAQEGVSR